MSLGLLWPLVDFAGSEYVLLGAAPAGSVPGGVFGKVPLAPVGVDPVDPLAMPNVPPVDPDGALLPLVVVDMLEVSVLGAGGSFF